MKIHTPLLIAVTALAVGIAAIAVPPPAQAQEERNYILATASTGGTYYPVGVALSTLVKVKLQPKQKIGMSAINSAGSGENIKLLRDNEAQFAIVQGLYGDFAWNGTGPVAADVPQKQLRSVTMLWQNVEQFIVPSDKAKTGTIADFVAMKGAKASLGRENSGTIGSNRTILAGFGVDIDSYYDLVYLGYGPSADAMQNGQITIMNTPAGVPTSAITQVFAAMGDDVTMLNFTDEQIAKANAKVSGQLWTAYMIPAGTYPGVDADVRAIAQPNFLATREAVNADAIYQITKTIYENLAFLQNIHPATKAMSLESALAGLPVPLHPGALAYYEEVGVDVPDSLKP